MQIYSLLALALVGCRPTGVAAPPVSERTEIAGPITNLAWSVRAIDLVSLDTCFTGSPCTGSDCCEFRSANGTIVKLANDGALRSIAPADAYGLDPAVCVHTSLNATEQGTLGEVAQAFVRDVARDSNGAIRVAVTRAAASASIALDRLGECTFWPSPSSLRSTLAQTIDRDVDSVVLFFDTLTEDGGVALSAPYCDLAASMFHGLSGAGFVVIPRTQAWTSDANDLGCARPINLHHGTLGHNLDVALAVAGFRTPYKAPDTQVARWSPDAAAYPACGQRPPLTSYLPDIHDAEEDPDFATCQYPTWEAYCAALGPTHDTCNTQWQAHRLTHIPNLTLVGNHCRTGRAESDELGIDCGGMDCVACPPPSPPGPGTTQLSALQFSRASSGWGPLERDRSNGERDAGDGRPLSIGHVAYANGLGMHAPGELAIALGRRCQRFHAAVGIDDEVGAGGTVTFEVWGDGVVLAVSPVMRGGQPAHPLAVSVAGVGELVLRVADGGDGDATDHANWGDARIDCN